MLRVCFNCYGNYTTDRVFQWDQNHILHITGLDLTYAPAVHFCNKKSTEAICVQSEKVSDGFTVPIPNILLQDPYNVIAYVRMFDSDDGTAKTVEIINIPLVKRVKPGEYQFEDNVEVMSFERLEADIAEFIDNMSREFSELILDTEDKYNAFTTETTNNYTNFTNKVVKDYEYLKDETQSATGVKSGKVVAIADSRASGLPKISLFGKSVQNTYSGKNKLENKAISGTTYGLKHTVNDDKSVNLIGTATNMLDLYVIPYNDQITMPKGRYKISGCPSGGSESTYLFIIGTVINGNSTRLAVDYGDGGELILEEDTEIYALCRVHNGITVNHTFYPMIRDASITDDTYEPLVGGEVSPNPSYPQAITSVADDKSLVVKSVGKNLAESSANSSGVTQWQPCFYVKAELQANTEYTISFDTTVSNTIYLNENLVKESKTITTKGRSVLTFTTIDNLEKNSTNYNTSAGWILFKNYIQQSQPLDATNVQLEYGAEVTPYEPYVSTEASLTLADRLRGIPVASGGNYVDEDGQSWICNSVEKYADGSGKFIKRVEGRSLNGSEDWYEFANTGGLFYQYHTNLSNSKSMLNVLCSHFTPIEITDRKTTTGIIKYNDQTVRFALQLSLGIDTVDKWKEWLSNNIVTVFYELAEYVETDLTASQMAELEKLQTFEPYTTIYTDDMGEVEVAYFKNNFNGEFMDEHIHDDRYYRKDEIYKKSETYTREEIEAVVELCDGKLKDIIDEDLANKSDIDHTHKQLQVNGLSNNDKYYLDITPTGEVTVSYYNSVENNTSILWSNTYHNHDDRYYDKDSINIMLNGVADDLAERYTKDEANSLLKSYELPVGSFVLHHNQASLGQPFDYGTWECKGIVELTVDDGFNGSGVYDPYLWYRSA